MTERTDGAHSWLSRPGIYAGLQRLLGAGDSHPRFVREFLRPQTWDRILDIGCGPGTILRHLGDVEYVGFDISEEYIAAARAEFGSRGEFHCMDVRDADLQPDSFDLVSVMGVVHHLDAEGTASLFSLAAGVLKPEGRMVVIEPAFIDGQSPVARWLIGRDRGADVRSPEGYAAGAHPFFERVKTSTIDDLLRVPYTHAVLEAQGPRPEARS